MRSPLFLALGLALLALLAAPAQADTPAKCNYAEWLGTWEVFHSELGDKNIDCVHTPTMHRLTSVKFSEPNLAVSEKGVQGNWTAISRQGIELWMGGMIYFVFAGYNETHSLCDRTQIGWGHSVVGTEWHCIRAHRVSRSAGKKLLTEVGAPASAATEAALSHKPHATPRHLAAREPNRPYVTDHALLAKINAAQDWFTVGHYPEFEEMTLGEMQRRGGVPAEDEAFLAQLPKPQKPLLGAARDFPKSFDWRNVSGVDYTTPAKNQGKCGSCYSFAGTSMMEMRFRVRSNNKLRPNFSNQDVVSCSKFSQGCNGGFIYQSGGKYGRDYGFVEENCYPYEGVDTATCAPNPQPGCNPKRWKTAEYYYVGGFYGMSSVQGLMEELMTNGPVGISFMVYDDFRNYKGGVYSHKFTANLTHQFDPFQSTNHAVLLVGWGETDDGIPYWSVMNSWGTAWGENGYFRILRGVNDCNIESTGVAAIPLIE